MATFTAARFAEIIILPDEMHFSYSRQKRGGRNTGGQRLRFRLFGYRFMDRAAHFGVPRYRKSPSTSHLMPQVQTELPAANGDIEARSPHTFWALTLGSMGVVFGDIGTSPLYAFRVALDAAAEPNGIVTREIVLGV